jgi:hypothetical protein
LNVFTRPVASTAAIPHVPLFGCDAGHPSCPALPTLSSEFRLEPD